MHFGGRKVRKIKMRRYAARLIDLNNYLTALPREKASDKIRETELDKIFLNSMKNGWTKQAYVQVFDCGTII